MNKFIALLVLSCTANYALACGGGGIIIVAVLGFLGLLQIIITLLDYRFAGRSIRGTFLLTGLFIVGIVLFNILLSILDNFQDVWEGIYISLFIFSLFIFPFIAKTIIVRKFKDTFKRKDITTNSETVVQENKDVIIEEQNSNIK